MDGERHALIKKITTNLLNLLNGQSTCKGFEVTFCFPGKKIKAH